MERIYHYFWKYRISRGEPLPLATGGEMCVLDPGLYNEDAGPDFTAAKLLINQQKWIGNVEIHVKASDWKRHHHDGDAAYDTIILHAVGVDDMRIRRKDGNVVPQYVITVPPEAFATFARLDNNMRDIRCEGMISGVPSMVADCWVESLGVERLQDKASHVIDIYNSCGKDWQQTCFVILARALGFGLNSDPLEQLAKSVSLNILARHSDSILQLEAILFGQAGMLQASNHLFDEYYQTLCREYHFLSRKYGLSPIRTALWKYARTRPQNFPHRRIALLAQACRGGFSLFSTLMEATQQVDRDIVREVFDWEVSDYWKNHWSFDYDAEGFIGCLSSSSRDLLIINAASPLLYAYSGIHGEITSAENAMSLLEMLSPENNYIIKSWKSLGLIPRNAFQSQGLLHLKRQYCEAHKCLYCRIGHALLRSTVRPSPLK